MIRIAVALALLAAACGGAAAPHPLAPRDRVAIVSRAAGDGERGRVAGVVLDQTGLPVPGATVIFGADHQQDQVAITDDAGAFQLADLPPGPRALTIYYSDSTFQLGRVDVGPDRAVQLVATVTIPPESGLIIERCEDWGGCNPGVDMTSVQQGITIDRPQLQKLP